jgi:hypothetical protein
MINDSHRALSIKYNFTSLAANEIFSIDDKSEPIASLSRFSTMLSGKSQ